MQLWFSYMVFYIISIEESTSSGSLPDENSVNSKTSSIGTIVSSRKRGTNISRESYTRLIMFHQRPWHFLQNLRNKLRYELKSGRKKECYWKQTWKRKDENNKDTMKNG